MSKHIALSVGSAAAAGVLALGLAAAGFGPATLGDSAVMDDQAPAATGDTAASDPVVKVEAETIYVRPAAAPRVIHVTKRLPAPKVKPVTAPRKRSTRTSDEHDEHGEHEGGEGQDD